jgi:tetratricopeptide (TPR) repeat protein
MAGKGKVNTKFVVMLSVGIVAVCGLLAWVVATLAFKSGSDYERMADQAMADGEYAKAKILYGRAVSHDTTRLEWLEKWVKAIESWTPDTETAYRDAFITDYLPAKSQIAAVQQTNVEAHDQFLGLLYEQLSFGYSRPAADQLAQQATAAAAFFERNPGSDPTWKRLLRYRGMANELTVQSNGILTDDQFNLVGEDLREAIGANPADAFATEALMRWTVSAATRGIGNDTPERRAEARLAAKKIGEDFLAAHPGNPSIDTMILALDIDVAVAEAGQGKSDAARTSAIMDAVAALMPRLDSMAERLSAMDPSAVHRSVIERFQLIERAIDPAAQIRRSRAMVDALLAKAPEDGELVWIAAALDKTAGDFARASERYSQITDLKPIPVSIAGMRRFDLSRQAIMSRAIVQLDLIDAGRGSNSMTPEEQSKLIESARELRTRFAAQVSEDNQQLVLLDGRLADASGNTSEALRLYRRYNDQTQRRVPDGLWLEGRAAMALGQMGSARTSLQQLLDTDPNNFRALLTLAEIQNSLQDSRSARELYQRALTLSPGNSIAQEGLARINARENPESVDDPVISALLTARKLRAGGNGQPADPAGAARLLESTLEPQNYDPRIASELASVRVDQGDLEGARKIIAEAARRHPDSEQVDRLNQALAGADPTEVLLNMIELSDREEVEKQISIASVAISRGRADRVASAIEKLATLAPNDPRVVDLRFVNAMSNEDTPAAEQLADQAVSLNLDRVNGLSYKARLASYQARIELRKGEQTKSMALKAQSIAMLQQAAALGTGDSTIHRLLAIELREAGRTDDAVRSFETSLSIRPDDVQTIYEYVVTLARANRLAAALDVARRQQTFGQASPLFVELWLSLEAAAGGPEGRALAIRQRERVLEINPADRANRVYLAQLYMDDKKWQPAKVLIDQLKSEDRSLQMVEIEARWNADQGRVGSQDGLMLAQRAYQDFIVAQGDKATAAPYLSMARFMVGRGRQDLAIRAAEEAIKREDPASMEGTKLKGDLLMALGQADGAAVAFKAIVDAGRDDENSSYRQRLVEMYIRTGQWAAADEQIKALPESLSGTLTNLLQRGEIAAGRGDKAAERRLLDEAVAKHPSDALVYIKRAQSMLDRPELLQDIMSDIDAALRVSPNDWRAMRVRSAAYFAAGRDNEALADLRTALRSNPSLDDALFGIMNELLNTDRPSEAMDVARETLDARPTDAPLMSQVAKLFEAREDYARAAQMYKRAWDVRKSPNDGASFIDAALRLTPPDTDSANAVINELVNLVDGGIDQSAGLLAAQALVLRARGREDFAQQQMTKAFDISVGDDIKLQNWAQNAARFYLNMKPEDELNYYRSLRVRYTDPTVRAWLDLFIAQRSLALNQAVPEALSLFDTLAGSESIPLSIRRAAFRSLGNQFYETEQYEQAIDAWKRGLDISPNDWELNNNMAYTLSAKLGKHDEGLRLAELAVAADPGRSEPYDTLGGIYIELGKLSEAEQMIQLGEQRARSYAARVTMAITRAKLENARGNKKEATRLLENARSVLRATAGFDKHLEAEIDLVEARIGSQG